MKKLFTILSGLLLWSNTYSQKPLWEFSITSNNIDFIKSDDPDDFRSVSYLGTRNRVEMPSKEKPRLFEDGVHIFEAKFATGKVLPIWVSGDLGNARQARTWVDKLTPRLGKLPVQNREKLDHVNIHRGGPDTTADAEVQGRFFNLYSQNMDVRIRNNDLGETVFHESVHAGYQEDWQETTDWRDAVRKDNAYITEYARDFSLDDGTKLEDMPEHAIFCYTYLRYPGRLPANVENFVINHLQNRTAFFREIIGYPDNTGKSSIDTQEPIDITEGWYKIKNLETGRYLRSVKRESIIAGSVSTGNDKQWRFVKSGNYYNIDSRTTSTGKGILRAKQNDIIGTSRTAPRNDSDKVWSINEVSKPKGTYRIELRDTERYIYNETNDGNKVLQLNTKIGNRSKWYLEPVNSAKTTEKKQAADPEEIIKNNSEKEIAVYPNPTTNEFHISLKGIEKAAVFITDILGKVVYRNTITNQLHITKNNTFSKGVYLIKVADENQKNYRKKLIIK